MVPPKKVLKDMMPPPIKLPPPQNFDVPYIYVAMSKAPKKDIYPNPMKANNGNKPLRNRASGPK